MDVFDKKVLELMKKKTVTYAIGIDTADPKIASYCLVRNIDGVCEVILSKTMKNTLSFNHETKNLARYFNAKLIKEKEPNP